MSMTKADLEREERRREQKEIAESLKSSRALDGIFARIDAGEPLTGHEGLLKRMSKATLERGMEAELSDHVGYDCDDRTWRSSRTRDRRLSERRTRCWGARTRWRGSVRHVRGLLPRTTR